MDSCIESAVAVAVAAENAYTAYAVASELVGVAGVVVAVEATSFAGSHVAGVANSQLCKKLAASYCTLSYDTAWR